jgi:hypothetical protein
MRISAYTIQMSSRQVACLGSIQQLRDPTFIQAP